MKKNQNKHIHFSQFIKKWNYKFQVIFKVLKYIQKNPKINTILPDFSPINPRQLEKSQSEWIYLVNSFNHKVDKVFFKVFWVPINSKGYDYFIDLSSNTFTLFEIEYFYYEPYNWFKKIIFEDITDFLISSENKSYSREIIQQCEK